MDRVTVAEAAKRLGVTQDAVRQRIRRGTIDHDKDETGRVYVYLMPTDTVHDNVRDGAHDTDHDNVRDALVEELRDRIRYLEEEARRKDAILLTMAQRIPELEPAKEAPPEPRESSVIASEERGSVSSPPEPREEEEKEGPETVSAASTEEGEGVETPLRQEHRSFWRRLFGP